MRRGVELLPVLTTTPPTRPWLGSGRLVNPKSGVLLHSLAPRHTASSVNPRAIRKKMLVLERHHGNTERHYTTTEELTPALAARGRVRGKGCRMASHVARRCSHLLSKSTTSHAHTAKENH